MQMEAIKRQLTGSGSENSSSSMLNMGCVGSKPAMLVGVTCDTTNVLLSVTQTQNI